MAKVKSAKTKVETVLKAGVDRIRAQMEKMDWGDKRLYACWLAQTYYFVCHSTRLLGAAASRFGVDRDAEHIQLIDHAKEERRHERIAENDLRSIGYSVRDFPEFPEAKALYQCAYYQIERENPMGVYGYILLLESLSLAIGIDIQRRAAESFGLKPTGFLKVHTQDDVDHLKTYEGLICGASMRELEAIVSAVEIAAMNYLRLLEAVHEAADAEMGRRAA